MSISFMNIVSIENPFRDLDEPATIPLVQKGQAPKVFDLIQKPCAGSKDFEDEGSLDEIPACFN